MAARTICIPEGNTGRVKLDLGTTQDALSNSLNTYTITLGTAVAADISNMALTGTPTVNGAELYVDIVVPTNAPTSGDRTFTIVISAFGGAITQTWNGTIKDRYIATQTVNVTASSSSVNEGQTVTFSCEATNVNEGDTLPYTISGINSADIGGESLTGSFTFPADTCSATSIAQKTFNITADASTEGTETMTLTMDSSGGVPAGNPNLQASVTINDTSPTPSPSYSLSGTDVTEGGTITWTFTATNTTIPDGTTINYTVSSSDSRFTGATSGSFTTTSNSGTFTSTTADNNVDEGTGTVTANITTVPYNTASASASIFDDDPADYNKLVSVPLAWKATYNQNDNECTALTPNAYIQVIDGNGSGVQVPTAVSVTKGSPSTVTITSTQWVDNTANQGGYKADVITSFNSIATASPVTGTTTSLIGYDD